MRNCHDVIINDISLRDMGLILTAATIGEPEVNTHIVEVPGRSTPLDMTEILFGRVTYKSRPLSFTFAIIGDCANWSGMSSKLKNLFHGKAVKVVASYDPGWYWNKSRPLSFTFAIIGDCANWSGMSSKLKNLFHGKAVKVVASYDPGWYWKGRATVAATKEEKRVNSFVISVQAEPFKYSSVNLTERWRWNPFSFRDGIIREYGNMQIPAGKKIVIIGSPEPVTPKVKVSQPMSVTVGGKSWQLPSEEWTELTGLKIGRQPVLFEFSTPGVVSVTFQEVSL